MTVLENAMTAYMMPIHGRMYVSFHMTELMMPQ